MNNIIDTRFLQTTANDSYAALLIFVSVACIVSALWALFNWINVSNTIINRTSNQAEVFLEDTIGRVTIGIRDFLMNQYLVIGIACVTVFLLIWGASQKLKVAYASLAFLFGATLSVLSVVLIVQLTQKIKFRCINQVHESFSNLFNILSKVSSAIAFFSTSLFLLVLVIFIAVYGQMLINNPLVILTPVLGFGLGIVTVGLFIRVGGGIFAKGADVGADLIGKINYELQQDDHNNSGVTADIVGDIVGNYLANFLQVIAIWITVLCLAFLASAAESNATVGLKILLLPLVNYGIGLIISVLVNSAFRYLYSVNGEDEVKKFYILQIIITNLANLLLFILSTFVIVPNTNITNWDQYGSTSAYFSQLFGILGGMVISLITWSTFQSDSKPIREVANACDTGSATNVIYGLALGMWGTVLPALVVSLAGYASYLLMGFYGVSLAATSMLSGAPIILTTHLFQNLSDCCQALATFSRYDDHHIFSYFKQITSGARSATRITKGIYTGSSTLAAISFYPVYLTLAKLVSTKKHKISLGLSEPTVFAGLLIGAMIPYLISSLTLRAAGQQSILFCTELKNSGKIQKSTILKLSNSSRRVTAQSHESLLKFESEFNQKLTANTLYYQILPCIIIISLPILLGMIFGPKLIVGFIPGIIVSAFQMNLNLIYTGDLWSTVNKAIENLKYFDQKGIEMKNNRETYKASIVGDLFGDPLKDISGPSVNTIVLIVSSLAILFGQMFANLRS